MNSQSAAPISQSKQANKYLFAFALITSLFFFWGFVNNLNPILIPHLRRAFRLTNVEAALVDSAIYIAYFLMAIPAGAIMKKYGYKNGIVFGLFLFGIGCFLFIPAANTMQYPFFLGALFVVACGLATLETAANPYATVLGPPETATQRLNFAQSFNGLAAFVAPIVGGRLILADNPLSDAEVDAMDATARHAYLLSETSTVKLPYVVLGIVILVVAIIFIFTKLPDIKDSEDGKPRNFFHAFKHKHLIWAVIAQFFYVGAQACILSFLILFATKAAGINEKEASWYSGVAGLAFMLGRFVGTFFMRYVKPVKLLAIYAIVCILLCLIAIFGTGMITVYTMIAIAFFMSIMFPTIFALGISGIGPDTKAGSSLLVMAIFGGAVLPPVLGLIADKTGNLQYGYVVPLICFTFIAWYAKVGVKADAPTKLSVSGGH